MSARRVRRFQLERDVDVSGVSGTGSVAFGAQAPDGTCVLWWASGLESTTIYPNMETLLAIHGHGGKTRAIYIDPETWDGATAPAGDGDGGCAGRATGTGLTGAAACAGGTRLGRGGASDATGESDAEPAADADDPAEEPARALAWAGGTRAVPRAAAHQPRPASRPVRPPSHSS
jgi:hypothetical protein